MFFFKDIGTHIMKKRSLIKGFFRRNINDLSTRIGDGKNESLPNFDLIEITEKAGNLSHYLPVTIVPPLHRIKYDMKWQGLTLPVISSNTVGGLGNVMGEYATLYALSKIYNTSAVISHKMATKLKKIFPKISIPVTPGRFVIHVFYVSIIVLFGN